MDITDVNVQGKIQMSHRYGLDVTVNFQKIYNFHAHNKEIENNYIATPNFILFF